MGRVAAVTIEQRLRDPAFTYACAWKISIATRLREMKRSAKYRLAEGRHSPDAICSRSVENAPSIPRPCLSRVFLAARSMSQPTPAGSAGLRRRTFPGEKFGLVP